MMHEENVITATTLNDIIVHKLTGIVNKLEIVAATDEDRHLDRELQTILKQHRKLAVKLQNESKD